MTATYETDTYARILAHVLNFTPEEDMKYECLKINQNNWHFLLAKRRRGVNILIAVDCDELEKER